MALKQYRVIGTASYGSVEPNVAGVPIWYKHGNLPDGTVFMASAPILVYDILNLPIAVVIRDGVNDTMKYVAFSDGVNGHLQETTVIPALPSKTVTASPIKAVKYKGFIDDDEDCRKTYGLTLAEQQAMFLQQEKFTPKTDTPKTDTAWSAEDYTKVISTGVGVLSALLTMTAKQKTAAEYVCGKRPRGILGIKGKRKKAKIAAWEKCVADYLKTPKTTPTPTPYTPYIPKPKKKGLSTGAWIGIGAVGIAILAGAGFLILKK